jgi:hypothetical protein
MLFAVSAGTLGAAALMAGPAHAAGAATSCGNLALQKVCPPVPTVSKAAPSTSGGPEQITVTWTPAAGDTMDPDATKTSLTIQWTPPTTIPPGAPQPPLGAETAAGSCMASGGNLLCTYSWPAGLGDSGYVLNGTYSLSATSDDCRIAIGVVAGCSMPPTVVTGTATVANPPQPPTNVKAVLDPGSNAVNITWTPSPEPDVVGYEVVRNNGGVVCTLDTFPPPSAYACTDSSSGGGSFSYHVVAYRYGATYAPTAELNTASTDTASVMVQGPPATTVPGGGGGTTPITQPGFTATPAPSKTKIGGGLGGGAFAATPSPAPAAITTTTSGGAFSPVLPYGAQPAPPTSADPQALGVPKPVSKGGSPIGTIAAIGAGLLVAVIALHGLWLRSEVRRGDALEPLDPEA